MAFPRASQPAPALAAPSPCRLFLALWPETDERAQLLDYLQQWSWPRGCAPVSPARLHLTLHFIGAVERQRLAAVSGALQVPMTPFELTLSRAEIWPRGLVVLHAAPVPDALIQLHARLGAALRGLGLPLERRHFRPHLTLARRAAGTLLPSAAPALRWQVSSYVLVESMPGDGGGYHIRARYG